MNFVYLFYKVTQGNEWSYTQEYGVFYNSGKEPNDTELFNFFVCQEGSKYTKDYTYSEWIFRLDEAFDHLKTEGAWYLPRKNPF